MNTLCHILSENSSCRYICESGAKRCGKSPRLAPKVQVNRPVKINSVVVEALHSLISSSAKVCVKV